MEDDFDLALRRSVASGDDFLIAQAIYRFAQAEPGAWERARLILRKRYPKFFDLVRRREQAGGRAHV